ERCNVAKTNGIKKEGLLQQVKIQCKGDEKSEEFNLRISPKVKLKLNNGEETEYSIGDKLPIDGKGDNTKSIFLGFVGETKTNENKEILYARFVEAPYHEDRLSDKMLSEVASYDSGSWGAQNQGSWLKKVFMFVGKATWENIKRFANYLVAGTEISEAIESNNKSAVVYGNKIEIVGLGDGGDTTLLKESKEYYELAQQNFNNVINTYPSEKYPAGYETTLSEDAFSQSIFIAEMMQQKKSVSNLCKEFKEKYPDSRYVKNYFSTGQVCSDIRIANSEIATKEISINGVVKRISFESVNEPDFEDYGVELILTNTGNYSGSKSLKKGGIVYLSENETITLREIKDDRVEFDVNIEEAWYKEVGWKTNKLEVMLNDFKIIGRPGYKIFVNKINLKKSAKVSVIPSINNAGTEANFSFKIGIEQRNIKLSPEKTKERIKNLDETIKEWEKKSESLGKVVTGFKAACFATSAGLMIKNFLSNIGGAAIARQDVMRMEGGWNEKCKSMVNDKKYSTLDACFIDKAKDIDAEVEARLEKMETQNTEMKNLQSGCKVENPISKLLIEEEHYDTECVKKNLLEKPNYKNDLKAKLNGIFSSGEIVSQGQTIKIDDFVGNLSSDKTNLEDLRSLQLNSQLKGTEEALKSTIIDIYQTTKDEIAQTTFSKTLGEKLKVDGLEIGTYSDKDAIEGIYNGRKMPNGLGDIPKDASYQPIVYGNKNYILHLENTQGNEYQIVNVTDIDGNTITDKLITNDILKKFKFKQYDPKTYQNPYKNPELNYFETEPYAGLPANVPVDVKNGWYASIAQTLPVGGNIKSYDASGAVSS
ncbi:MAG: hypothetical protein AABX88_01875, partial [Nanoarchaeota archaeon]